MNYDALHRPYALFASHTSSRLWLWRRAEQFDEALDVDYETNQEVLNPHSESSPVTHAPSAVPANHLPQFSFDPRMFFPHLFELLGQCALPRCRGFRFVLTLDPCPPFFCLGLEALRAQRAVGALRGSKMKLPPAIAIGARPRTWFLLAGATPLLTRFMELKIFGLEQPWFATGPLPGRHNDLELRPRLRLQFTQDGATNAHPIHRAPLTLIAVWLLLALDERLGVGRLVSVRRQDLPCAAHFRIGVDTDIQQVPVGAGAVLAG